MVFGAAHASCRGSGRLRAARAVLAAAFLAASRPALALCGTPEGPVRVAGVDDWLDLVLADGRTVRLGGLALPDPARAPALAGGARDVLTSRVVGRDGELARLAPETDRWGRVVADVRFAGPGPDGRPETAAGILLATGYARVAPAFETRGCVADRMVLEDAARRAGLGVWAVPAAGIIRASDAAALKQNGGRFVVIEGRVRRVGFGRSRLYLDMVPRGGPTIVVPRKLVAAFARAGRPVETAAGQTIRARGALDTRLGPRLEVSEPAMIEFLGRSDAPAGDRARP